MNIMCEWCTFVFEGYRVYLWEIIGTQKLAKILQTKMAIFIDAACGIMDLNQYIGSMNAKDCIYRNPNSMKWQDLYGIAWAG
jgi:hypothetical protein